MRGDNINQMGIGNGAENCYRELSKATVETRELPGSSAAVRCEERNRLLDLF